MLFGSSFFSHLSERLFTRIRDRRAACVIGLAALVLLVSGLASASGDQAVVDAVYAKYGDRMPVINAQGDARGELAVYKAPADAPRIDCRELTGPRGMVALVFGQSNASNTVDPGYGATQAVYAYQAGVCRKVRDAIAGATGSKGSAWARLGDRIVTSGLYDTVLYVDIARGGSSILNWGPKGNLHALLESTVKDMRAHGLAPTHVFFHQGEADCALGLTRQEYQAVLKTVLSDTRRLVGPKPGIFVSRASLFLDPVCGNTRNPGCYKSCPAITAAQTAVIDPERGIYPGPNTDLIVPWFDRNDGYHFTAQAADHFAAAWMPLLAGGEAAGQPLQ
ncbi:protein of unknown function DUF303 acetylesterase putative [Solidesulfovibrio fructosivorans JJ]]|uniref:Sialate O-acetylesterase domain-containing protein n=1 Tax=Solidesulfovibrio fructosivorans JJ] TaxID=596151 RepID=E1JU06_SOLFR|nr:sialate O-acetylesterase [Solidesulfovibrio fructosivorans]EFL52285.1 protein of unknown function DUF303 acetylesterase putative [Solidesulfovibrio fructosivorans JJ]]